MGKIDDVIDRLERLNAQVLEVKRAIIPLLPLPPIAKPLARRTVDGLDPIIAELYFDALRGGVDLARMPENQDAALRAFQVGLPPVGRKPRTKAQKKNDNMQSKAFKVANEKLRTTKGTLRKGVTQADVATRAQKELKKMKLAVRPGKPGSRARKSRPSPSGGTKKRTKPARSGGGRR